MADRCYMQVTCRRQDQDTFEALGFVLEYDEAPDSPIIELTDEQANYAHCGKLPTDIPFTAWHGAGGDYGDGRIACDGKRWGEVACSPDSSFVVDWNFKPVFYSAKGGRRRTLRKPQ